MKKNCWEFKKCGRDLSEGLDPNGICPAAYAVDLDGVHDGICAGRACWVVAGTYCNGSVQGTFAMKYKNCGTCDFYEYVKEQEGEDFKPTVLLLSLVEENQQS